MEREEAIARIARSVPGVGADSEKIPTPREASGTNRSRARNAGPGIPIHVVRSPLYLSRMTSPTRNNQTARLLQDGVTALSPADVLAAAVRFFATDSGVYSAFPEKQGPTHVVLRGQGGEEIVIGVREVPGGTGVTGSSYLFDQQIAQFIASLPPAPPAAPVAPADDVAALPVGEGAV